MTAVTLSATGAITPSQTAGIVGTTTNNNASAGAVGEFVTATGTATSLTSGTVVNLASIPLTAGDWDVWGTVYFSNATGTTSTSQLAWCSTTSATAPAVPLYNIIGASIPQNTANSVNTQPLRISIASTTTVYVSGEAFFSGGTATGTGFIRARRIR
ncbi:hypothetical protein [Caballeronia arationis]|uniref:hypothetical protein n=1 Tax=Caballeronia arationis TaxID=1777142 RepID=UPI000BE25CBD|nr:hypothetical protein [Caballeronia arationis]